MLKGRSLWRQMTGRRFQGGRVGWGPKVSGFICVATEDTPNNHLRRSNVICWQVTGSEGEGKRFEKAIIEWEE